jgi:outer membrane protein
MVAIWPLPVQSLTLSEAHRLAVTRAEQIAISDASIQEAEAEYRRRFSVVYPTFSLRASEVMQDVPGGTTSGDTVQDTFVRRFTPDVTLEMAYPLFAGFKQYAGLDVAKAGIRGQTFSKKRSEEMLYASVALSFYGVLQRERSLELNESRRKILADRAAELRRFEKIGRSRPSERVTVEADMKRLEADIQTLTGELESQRTLLEFWIGGKIPSPLDGGGDNVTAPSAEECLKGAKSRSDVESLRESVVSFDRQVSVDKGDYWPTLDLRAHYYPYQVGFRDLIDWDVGVFLNYSFFQGGLTKQTVAKTRAQLKAAEYRLGQAERQAELDVRNRDTDLKTTMVRLKTLGEALQLLEENYKLQSKEYRLGLVTNLEVLSALSRLFETKVDVERARFQAKTDAVNLEVACGKTP